MSLATQAPPEPDRKTAGPPPTPPPRRRRADRGFRRALVWGVCISVLVHLVLFLLPPSFTVSVDRTAGEADPVERMDRLEMVVATPRPAADPADTPVTEPRPVPDDPAPSREDPAQSEPAPDEPEAAERPGAPGPSPLLPPQRDPRLHVEPRVGEEEPGFVPSQHERYMAHLRARIDALNDSTAVEAERRRRATDWTVRDGDGQRWGISPEGIHLGPITLPPIPFRGSPGHDEAHRERERQREEIRRQEESRERDDARREAADETRRRRNAERDDAG